MERLVCVAHRVDCMGRLIAMGLTLANYFAAPRNLAVDHRSDWNICPAHMLSGLFPFRTVCN